VEEIGKHPTLIVIGETGSGKTTQVCQYSCANKFHTCWLVLFISFSFRFHSLFLQAALEAVEPLPLLSRDEWPPSLWPQE
jgi:hypothetical protein